VSGWDGNIELSVSLFDDGPAGLTSPGDWGICLSGKTKVFLSPPPLLLVLLSVPAALSASASALDPSRLLSSWSRGLDEDSKATWWLRRDTRSGRGWVRHKAPGTEGQGLVGVVATVSWCANKGWPLRDGAC
jgi:hypothetical protein